MNMFASQAGSGASSMNGDRAQKATLVTCTPERTNRRAEVAIVRASGVGLANPSLRRKVKTVNRAASVIGVEVGPRATASQRTSTGGA
jgi:hypothetical protein